MNSTKSELYSSGISKVCLDKILEQAGLKIGQVPGR